MKKWLLAAVALVVVSAAPAQEPGFEYRRDSLGRETQGFTLPDSLTQMSPWSPSYKTMAPLGTKPSVSMTSIMAIPRNNLPAHVTVLENNTLRLTPHLTISVGQAWNWGPFLDSYLDARTLSFPLPR